MLAGRFRGRPGPLNVVFYRRQVLAPFALRFPHRKLRQVRFRGEEPFSGFLRPDVQNVLGPNAKLPDPLVVAADRAKRLAGPPLTKFSAWLLRAYLNLCRS
jgi:hypothetical protein